MPGKAVRTVLFGLVALAKTNHVWRHHPCPGLHKHRDHLAVQVAPGRVAVQAQVGHARVARPLVQVVQAQTGQGRQVAQVMRGPRVIRQMFKRLRGGAQRVFTHGVMVQTGLHTPGFEKPLQQRRTWLGQHAALHFGLVVEPGFGQQIDHRAGCAGFRVGRAEHHAFEPGVQHGTNAHGAGLQGDIQHTLIEPVIAQCLGCGAQGHHFGVGARVVAADGRVTALPDHPPLVHHHRTYRHFTRRPGQTGLRQCQAHGVFVSHADLGLASPCQAAPSKAPRPVRCHCHWRTGHAVWRVTRADVG